MPPVLATLLPFAPLFLKGILGFLPANAARVVGTALDAARQGIAIAQPVLNTLENVSVADRDSKDISIAEMESAIAAMHQPGEYERLMAELAAKK